MSRGMINNKVNEIANKFLGREITTKELRLYPYIQYVMINEQKLEPQRITVEERAIFQNLKKEGHLDGGAGGLLITKEFWDYLHEVLFVSYVDI